MDRKDAEKSRKCVLNTKEDSDMAVLTKPVSVSFQLDPKKVDDFIKDTDKTALKKVTKRAEKYITASEQNKKK
jgi:hypothetical protein